MKRRASQQKGIKLQIYKVGSYKWNFLWERQKSLTAKVDHPRESPRLRQCCVFNRKLPKPRNFCKYAERKQEGQWAYLQTTA